MLRTLHTSHMHEVWTSRILSHRCRMPVSSGVQVDDLQSVGVSAGTGIICLLVCKHIHSRKPQPARWLGHQVFLSRQHHQPAMLNVHLQYR